MGSHCEVMGVIVYGSHARSIADSLSDLDLAIIVDSGKEMYDYIEAEKRDLDIAYIPLSRLEEVAAEAFHRSNHSLWLTHSMYLKILRSGKIVYDPTGKIEEYRDSVKNWVWTREDLLDAEEHMREIMDLALEMLVEKRLFEALILLGDVINIYMIKKDMMENNIPSPQPRDLFDTARKHCLLKQYITIHRLEHVREETILETTKIIKEYEWDPYARRNLKTITRLLRRSEKEKAILTARKALLGIIDQNMRSPKNMYSPELKIRVLENMDYKEKDALLKLYGFNH